MLELLKSGTRYLLVFSVFSALILLLPFNIQLPTDIFVFMVDGTFNDIMRTLNYFIPVSYVLSCITLLFSLKHFGFLWSSIEWVFHKVFS